MRFQRLPTKAPGRSVKATPHALHAAPSGEDNIFVTIPGKASADAEPARLHMVTSIPPDHFPGLHWYHPHLASAWAGSRAWRWGSPCILSSTDRPMGCSAVRDVTRSGVPAWAAPLPLS